MPKAAEIGDAREAKENGRRMLYNGASGLDVILLLCFVSSYLPSFYPPHSSPSCLFFPILPVFVFCVYLHLLVFLSPQRAEAVLAGWRGALEGRLCKVARL